MVANLLFSASDDSRYYANKSTFIYNWMTGELPGRLTCGPTHDILMYLIKDRFWLPTRKVTFPGTFYWEGGVYKVTHNPLEVYLPDLEKWVLFDVNYAFFIKWKNAFEVVRLIRENSSPYDTGYFGNSIFLADIYADAPRSYLAKAFFDGNWASVDAPFSMAEVTVYPVSGLWRDEFRFYYSGAAYWGGNVGWQMPHGTEFLQGDYFLASKHTDKGLEEEAVSWIQRFGLTVTSLNEDVLAGMLEEGFRREIGEQKWLARLPQAAR